jgi:1,2-phenylacetyl-CoA epoxidase catalytic subunit
MMVKKPTITKKATTSKKTKAMMMEGLASLELAEEVEPQTPADEFTKLHTRWATHFSRLHCATC